MNKHAKVVRLDVRPTKRAHLTFDIEGVLGETNVALGQSVTAFDFTSFYAGLLATVSGLPAQLQYDSGTIATSVASSTLAALRAEPRKAALDSAIAARANAYYAKYANVAGIIALTNQYYAPGSPGSKPSRLADLATLSQNQSNLLQAAYTADGRLGVVRSTTSTLVATTTTIGDSDTNAGAITIGSDITDGSSFATTSGSDSDTSIGIGVTSGGVSSESTVADGSDSGSDVSTSSSVATSIQTSSDTSETASLGTALENQAISNTDYGYRVPSLESLAQNDRAQISLMDESYAQFMASQNLPYLAQVLDNELAIIDLGVKQLQVSYLDTLLLSPIDGVITGVYKGLGDRVRRGDVVVRVESNDTVHIVGTLVCHDRIDLGDTVSVKTTQFSNPADSKTISGTVAAVRGHPSNDDWWSVVVTCSNLDGSGNQVFPLHYHFDYDDTHVTIS